MKLTQPGQSELQAAKVLNGLLQAGNQEKRLLLENLDGTIIRLLIQLRENLPCNLSL
jgi:hypothetical protein